MDNSPAITSLLSIMADEELLMRKRIEAAENLITFELPEGVFEVTKRFLEDVAGSESAGVNVKIEAAKILRKIEARRVVPGTVQAQVETRRLWQRLATAKRRKRLVDAGEWPAPPDWDEDIRSDDFPTPDGSPFGGAVGLAERLEEARLKH